MKFTPASPEALLLAILDSEGLTLAEQYNALHAALSAVVRRQMTEVHGRPV